MSDVNEGATYAAALAELAEKLHNSAESYCPDNQFAARDGDGDTDADADDIHGELMQLGRHHSGKSYYNSEEKDNNDNL